MLSVYDWALMINQNCQTRQGKIVKLIGIKIEGVNLSLFTSNGTYKSLELTPILKSFDQMSEDVRNEFETFMIESNIDFGFENPESFDYDEFGISFHEVCESICSENPCYNCYQQLQLDSMLSDWLTRRGVDCREWIPQKLAIKYSKET